jgi:predicted GIY-YIG superfamily endonuclease
MEHSFPCWFVYVLKSLKKGFIYVGSTGNLQRRLAEHNRGDVQSTKAHVPLEMVAYVAVPTNKKARELEKYFKTGSGKAILKKRILTDEVPRSGT